MSATDTLDSFFLTKPFVTDDLKARVEDVKNELVGLQFEYTDAQGEFTRVQADLLKMEEKSDYLVNELAKSLTMFEPPPDGDAANAHKFMEKYIHDPAEWASLYAGAIGGGVWLLGTAGPKFLKLMSKASRFRRLGPLAKSSKWLKVAKLGKASVVFSVVVFAADFVVQIATAGAINKELREQWEQLKTQRDVAKSELADLKEVVAEAKKNRDEILEEAECESIDEFVKSLNGAITALGRQTGYMRTARRMLLAGQPPANVEMFVPDIPAESIAGMAKKIAVEQGFLNGESVDQLVETTGLKAVEVQAVIKMMQARLALIGGKNVEEAANDSSFDTNVVEGIEDALEEDRKHAETLISRGVDSNVIMLQSIIPLEEVDRLRKQTA